MCRASSPRPTLCNCAPERVGRWTLIPVAYRVQAAALAALNPRENGALPDLGCLRVPRKVWAVADELQMPSSTLCFWGFRGGFGLHRGNGSLIMGKREPEEATRNAFKGRGFL